MNQKLLELMRAARKAAGLRQSEVGAKLGVKDATISSWETGKSEPDIDEFVEYCRACGADYKTMLTIAYGDPTEPRKEIMCTVAEAALLEKYRALDERARRVVLRVLNAEYDEAGRHLAEELSIEVGAG